MWKPGDLTISLLFWEEEGALSIAWVMLFSHISRLDVKVLLPGRAPTVPQFVICKLRERYSPESALENSTKETQRQNEHGITEHVMLNR